MAVMVCMNISRCYKASAQFEGCREAITEVPTIISDLCRILYYNVSVCLSVCVFVCVCCLCLCVYVCVCLPICLSVWLLP